MVDKDKKKVDFKSIVKGLSSIQFVILSGVIVVVIYIFQNISILNKKDMHINAILVFIATCAAVSGIGGFLNILFLNGYISKTISVFEKFNPKNIEEFKKLANKIEENININKAKEDIDSEEFLKSIKNFRDTLSRIPTQFCDIEQRLKIFQEMKTTYLWGCGIFMVVGFIEAMYLFLGKA